MSLPPGTRIPELSPYELELLADGKRTSHVAEALFELELKRSLHPRGYYRGLVEGLTLGAVAGIMLGLLCAALAWSHLGG